MTQEVEPVRAPIRINEDGYGEIEVDFGYIGDYMRTASMIAATEGIPMQFTFNGKVHKITPEEAKEVWSPDHIKESIISSRRIIRNHRVKIMEEERVVEKVKEVGRILYGEEFAGEIKEL